MSDTPTETTTPRPGPSIWPAGLQPIASGAPVLKVLLVLAMILGFLLPLAMVRGVILERQYRQQSVVEEIGRLWGHRQQVIGPILAIPYRDPVIDRNGEAGYRDRMAYVLPDRYDIGAEVRSEIRRRGLFEAVVYTADTVLAGTFQLPPRGEWSTDESEILWDEAVVIVGASDLRSIDSVVTIDWNGRALPLEPGAPALSSLIDARMSARAPDLEAAQGQAIAFEMRLALNGSDSLTVAPLGRESHVSIRSDWPDPSFTGAFLPDRRDISEQGFEADWTVSYYGRPFPQIWTAPAGQATGGEIAKAGFGVRFVQPVSAYLQAERSAKHGVLFIVFTFAVFFLFEIVGGQRIHVFQYGLVGMSLCLFYLLLVSLAEHVGFAAAYGVGAMAVVGQIALYTGRVLASRRRGAAIGALLAALYGGLYILLGLEDYALLFGSAALFAALGAVMYVTRDIDWYAVKRPAAATGG